MDECAVEGQYCDRHVTCTNTNGSFICGQCPFGYDGVHTCQRIILF